MFLKSVLLAYLLIFSISLFAQDAKLIHKANLPSPALDEISGIIHWSGKLYGIEDSGNDPVIFEIDSTTGSITKTITLGGATNQDWEDLTQDNQYIYIGDFGNNINGSRKDLKFYKIPKQSILNITGSSGTIPSGDIQIINFAYEDQNTFCPVDFPCSSNNTAFDCEAVIYDNGKLHLFTKNWVSDLTVHYTVPTTAGTYTATKLDNLATGGVLITGATKMNDRIVALLGYDNVNVKGLYTKGWIWLVTGFTDMDHVFQSATQKQKIDLGSVIVAGQIEGITAVKQTRVLVTNEKISSPFVVDAQIFGLNLDDYISNNLLPVGLTSLTSLLSGNTATLTWEYNNPGVNYFEIEVSVTGNNNDFKSVGKLSSLNTFPAAYRFTDNSSNDFSGVKYYRIKIVTLDSKVSYSKILTLRKNEGNAFNLLAAPSPFEDKLVISFYSNAKQNVQLTIMDMHGRKLQTHRLQCLPGKYNYSVEGLSGLSSGIFVVTAITKDHLYIRKVLKQ